MNYRVEWAIEVEADDWKGAAEEALAAQRDPASIATVFDVTNRLNERVRVDLTSGGQQALPMWPLGQLLDALKAAEGVIDNAAGRAPGEAAVRAVHRMVREAIAAGEAALEGGE
jgi:hypothetical protein